MSKLAADKSIFLFNKSLQENWSITKINWSCWASWLFQC